MTASLLVKDLTVEFVSAGYVVRPIQNLSFGAEEGELVAVLGPSGCGKTTLLSCLAGLLTPTSGRIVFNGTEVTELRGQAMAAYRTDSVGVVFQAFNLIPSLSARGNVLMPLRLARVSRKLARQKADDLLAKVGLTERAHYRPAQLSGGQQQRVAIARALVHDPPLVIADEPSAHLDYIQVEGILRLIRQLASAGRIVLVATHDDRITHIADRVIALAPDFTDAHMAPEQVHLVPGQMLFEQGDRGAFIYVVDDGAIDIFRRRADGTEEALAIMEPGSYFGELGPLLNLPRSASARAATDAVLTAYTVRGFRRAFPAAVPEAK